MKKLLILPLLLFFSVLIQAQDADKQLAKAREAYQKRRWASAERLLDKYILKNDNFEAYYLRAQTYLQLGDYEPALADYHTLIAMQPQADSLYLLRSEAWALYAMQAMAPEQPCNCPDDAKRLFNNLDESSVIDMRESLADAQKAVSLNPNSAAAQYRCGWLEQLFNNKESACNYFKKAAELGHKEAKEQLEQCD